MKVALASEANHVTIEPSPAWYIQHFEQALDMLCIAEIGGYFIDVNPAFTRTLGWSKAELLSQPIDHFMHPVDREKTLKARALLARGEAITDLENRYLCKDGSHRWLSWRSSISSDGETVFAVARDISERHKIDEQRHTSDKLISQEVLTGGFAHDFNNLLATISTNIELIPLKGHLNEAQRRNLNLALSSIQAANNLTSELVGLTALSKVEVPVIDLRPTLEKAVARAVQSQGATVDFSLAANLSHARVLFADFEKLVRNLFDNAVEAFSGPARITCSAQNRSVKVGDSDLPLPPGPYVVLTLSDSGSGILDEIRPKVFDAYFSTKPRGSIKGQGLGLTVCHAIMRRHGGHLNLEPNRPQGTTVRCHIPADSPTED
jgi:PAS domain S-box-containing protein